VKAAPLFLLLAGCYVTRQAAGQMEIVIGQEPVEPLIESDRVNADEARKLLVVLEARDFAERAIGLSRSDNYTTFYDTRGRPVSYVVSACRKDRFENYTWSFPIAGSFAYKGFFSRSAALAEAKALEEQGYDTTLREVAAYSTLGWFRDPVFSTMLRGTEAALVSLIIHELTHGTVHADGFTDFNEEVATFVGNRGALAFLAARYGPRSREVARAEAQFHDDALFDNFIRSLYDRLDALYASDAASEEKLRRREELFTGARAEFARLKSRFRTPAYFYFEKAKLNNAEIVAQRRYGGHDVYERIFRRAGESWVTFLTWMRLAAAAPDPSAAIRLMAEGKLP